MTVRLNQSIQNNELEKNRGDEAPQARILHSKVSPEIQIPLSFLLFLFFILPSFEQVSLYFPDVIIISLTAFDR